ncbi:MAG: TrkA family potassium uptake protein [Candidatus Sericytochromatia bacterium]|nr:TrkA family potassium uptake protein [Candidatus Sericytochromatia bacterium]
MPTPRKQFAVVGLGRFGSSVCSSLKQLGHEVLGIDASEDLVRRAHADEVATHVVRADATDKHALEELGLEGFDGVVIAIGSDMEASILSVLNLLDLGVPSLTAKASHARHGQVLERIGGSRVTVVYPESDMGRRVAHALGGVSLLESIHLDQHFSIIEVRVPAALAGKTLAEADLRARFGVTIVAVLGADGLQVSPEPAFRLQADALIAVIGANEKLEAMQTTLSRS